MSEWSGAVYRPVTRRISALMAGTMACRSPITAYRARSMTVAEKAADLILGNIPLAPATVEFYRHRPG